MTGFSPDRKRQLDIAAVEEAIRSTLGLAGRWTEVVGEYNLLAVR